MGSTKLAARQSVVALLSWSLVLAPFSSRVFAQDRPRDDAWDRVIASYNRELEKGRVTQRPGDTADDEATSALEKYRKFVFSDPDALALLAANAVYISVAAPSTVIFLRMRAQKYHRMINAVLEITRGMEAEQRLLAVKKLTDGTFKTLVAEKVPITELYEQLAREKNWMKRTGNTITDPATGRKVPEMIPDIERARGAYVEYVNGRTPPGGITAAEELAAKQKIVAQKMTPDEFKKYLAEEPKVAQAIADLHAANRLNISTEITELQKLEAQVLRSLQSLENQQVGAMREWLSNADLKLNAAQRDFLDAALRQRPEPTPGGTATPVEPALPPEKAMLEYAEYYDKHLRPKMIQAAVELEKVSGRQIFPKTTILVEGKLVSVPDVPLSADAAAAAPAEARALARYSAAREAVSNMDKELKTAAGEGKAYFTSRWRFLRRGLGVAFVVLLPALSAYYTKKMFDALEASKRANVTQMIAEGRERGLTYDLLNSMAKMVLYSCIQVWEEYRRKLIDAKPSPLKNYNFPLVPYDEKTKLPKIAEANFQEQSPFVLRMKGVLADVFVLHPGSVMNEEVFRDIFSRAFDLDARLKNLRDKEKIIGDLATKASVYYDKLDELTLKRIEDEIKQKEGTQQRPLGIPDFSK